MQKLKIRQGDWVIVCDGKKALILENVGDEKFPNLKTRKVQEHADPKTSDLGTDAPGRSFSSVGSGRSAVEQTDWHKQEEDRFLQKLVSQLDHAVNAGERSNASGSAALEKVRRMPHTRAGASGMTSNKPISPKKPTRFVCLSDGTSTLIVPASSVMAVYGKRSLIALATAGAVL